MRVEARFAIDRPRHRQAPRHSAAASERLCDDPPPGGRGDVATKRGNQSLRPSGIIAYLKNGGTLENAAAMANRASTRTTQLYDRRRDEVSLDEVVRSAEQRPLGIVVQAGAIEMGDQVFLEL